MRKAGVFLAIIVALIGLTVVSNVRGQGPLDRVGFLPLASRALVPTTTTTPSTTTTTTPTTGATTTTTPTTGATTTPTGSPTGTPTFPPPTFDGCQEDPNPSSAPDYPVRITDVDKEAETVTLRNVSNSTVDVSSYRMCSLNGNQEHTGLNGTLTPGQSRTFPRAGSSLIWNNSERDDGALYDDQGRLVSYWDD